MSSISVFAHAGNPFIAKTHVPLIQTSFSASSARYSSPSFSCHQHFRAVSSRFCHKSSLSSSLFYQYGRDLKSLPLFLSKCSESEHSSSASENVGEGELDEWLSRLPEKNKALYSHSLPCIEAWLRSLEFSQSEEDRACWFAQKTEWHAQLSLDMTDLHIRYFKSGPGNLGKDMERRFSYALSREDIEKAVLGGP